ncbi:hypothetical protein RhiJN_09706 [Ceratobasidium sp. AG-Ba]|nr:hypothetical protein RhiJN_09706 [Ceratobasidium sp. AG-Ba]QRW10449.1 hypothetical protein RhiLY_09448 [Ceratobasidium sp. AG-Ba]
MDPPLPNGTYVIGYPSGSIVHHPSDTGALSIQPPESVSPDVQKILVSYDGERRVYSFQFEKSKKYFMFEGSADNNTRIHPGDQPRYFIIERYQNSLDQFVISVADHKEFHLHPVVSPVISPIFPTWVGMTSDPEAVQGWHFQTVH